MEKVLKILMLEDIEEDAVLIERVLEKEHFKFTRLRVDTRESFINALKEFTPDVILSDHSLPQFNSVDALVICKQSEIVVPFILVTGAVSEEFAVNCLKRGADDYILKSNLSRLPMAIHHAIRQHENERGRLKQEELLQQQNEELHKINTELDSFVYSISHNLRSPLSSVLGLVNVAKLDLNEGPEVIEHYFDMIQGSILKLDKTLKEILDYSQNTRTEIDVSEINFEKHIADCFGQMKYIKGFEKIQQEIEIQQDAPFYSDQHRLSVIFNNLIANSIRYQDTLKHSQIIKITVIINPIYATITIWDNGIGIPKENLSQVFDMFFRASAMSDGAGLGLYIVKEMVGKLQGTVSITSKPARETLVTLTVPNCL